MEALIIIGIVIFFVYSLRGWFLGDNTGWFGGGDDDDGDGDGDGGGDGGGGCGGGGD